MTGDILLWVFLTKKNNLNSTWETLKNTAPGLTVNTYHGTIGSSMVLQIGSKTERLVKADGHCLMCLVHSKITSRFWCDDSIKYHYKVLRISFAQPIVSLLILSCLCWYLWVAAKDPLESVSSTLILGVLIMWLLQWKSSWKKSHLNNWQISINYFIYFKTAKLLHPGQRKLRIISQKE